MEHSKIKNELIVSHLLLFKKNLQNKIFHFEEIIEVFFIVKSPAKTNKCINNENPRLLQNKQTSFNNKDIK